MGDRTFVSLTVLAEHAEEARGYFTYSAYHHDDQCKEDGCAVCMFDFEEVNYGELPFLDRLEEAGIPFDSCWSSGDEYTSGQDSLRFTPNGVAIRKEISDAYINPPLQQLIALIDDPTALRTYILAHKERVHIVGWEHQAEYRKLYLTRRLIEPK